MLVGLRREQWLPLDYSTPYLQSHLTTCNMPVTAAPFTSIRANGRCQHCARKQSNQRTVLVMASPPLLVNSCSGKMGHATAEAVLRAGLQLVPFTFCSSDKGDGDTIDVSGQAVERVGPSKKSEVRRAREQQRFGYCNTLSSAKPCLNDTKRGTQYADKCMQGSEVAARGAACRCAADHRSNTREVHLYAVNDADERAGAQGAAAATRGSHHH